LNRRADGDIQEVDGGARSPNPIQNRPLEKLGIEMNMRDIMNHGTTKQGVKRMIV